MKCPANLKLGIEMGTKIVYNNIQRYEQCNGRRCRQRSYGHKLDYRIGKRVGIDSLAPNRYTVANATAGGEVYRAITGLATFEEAING